MTTSNKKGCLILHGFGGALYEIEPLANHLKALDYLVSTPMLKGHGQSMSKNRSQLKHIHYHEWLASAEQALTELHGQVDEVYVVGFSMGGLLATQLVHRDHQPIDAVVLLNTPYYFWDFGNITRNLLDDFKNRRTHHLKHYLHSGAKLPINAVYQFQLLLHRSKSIFKHIRCPLLVIQTLDDDSVQPRSAVTIFNLATSPLKQIKHIETGGHLVLLSQSQRLVCEIIQNFFERSS